MDLYRRLLQERKVEEQRRGRPLDMFHNLASRALHRRLADPPEDLPQYSADLHRLYRYVRRGSTNPGTGMRYMTLKQKYVKEHAELMNEARGQGELL